MIKKQLDNLPNALIYFSEFTHFILIYIYTSETLHLLMGGDGFINLSSIYGLLHKRRP